MGEFRYTTGALLGRFRVMRGIARGGHAEVYEVIDPAHGGRLAAKVAHGDSARLEQEARLASRVDHPNVARVHGCDVAEDGRPFMLLELLYGPTLADRVARGPLEVVPATAIAHDIARALEAVHARRVLHRDVKPGNVILTSGQHGPRVKLTDFGIAAELPRASALGDTRTHVVGTPSYMAPEQALGNDLDERADVYALGVVLYEMLAGVPPFGGAVESILSQHVMEPPLPLDAWRPDVPASVARIVGCALEKSPERRFPEMTSMRVALAGALAELRPAMAALRS